MQIVRTAVKRLYLKPWHNRKRYRGYRRAFILSFEMDDEHDLIIGHHNVKVELRAITEDRPLPKAMRESWQQSHPEDARQRRRLNTRRRKLAAAIDIMTCNYFERVGGRRRHH
jgi:hypothetical protein